MCVKKGFDLILEDFLDTIKNGHAVHAVTLYFFGFWWN